ncbi:MAG TPA: hypothetical protein DCG33_05995 [Prevotellaceae bacterium]|nr:hypothetical protein [Prevotellaceae bacterium]
MAKTSEIPLPAVFGNETVVYDFITLSTKTTTHTQHFEDTLSAYLQMLKHKKIDCSVLYVCGENVTFVSLFCYSLNTHQNEE